jgi:hydroquinone glucosyltransferase
LESITHGVPIIAWPLYAEQKINATTLTEEIGVAVKPVKGQGETVVKREEISRAVRLLMESEEGEIIRGRVKKLRDSARRAVDIGGSSYNSLSCLVEKWKNESSKP